MSTVKRKCQAILLEVNDNLALKSERKALTMLGKDLFNPFTNKIQHLYIVSDDEIKEGDFIIYANSILKILNVNSVGCLVKMSDGEFRIVKSHCKKIIATTDQSLTIEGKAPSGDIAWRFPFPKLSQSFIQKYITEYNKGNIIVDIMVEYECLVSEQIKLIDVSKSISEDLSESKCIESKLKINPKDNTITISKAKDNYSISEVKQLLYQAFISHKAINGKITPKEAEELIPAFNKWIEQNL